LKLGCGIRAPASRAPAGPKSSWAGRACAIPKFSTTQSLKNGSLPEAVVAKCQEVATISRRTSLVRLVHEEVGEPAWYQAEAIQGEAPQDSPGPNCRIAGEPEVIRISEAARWPSCGAADPCGCQARSGPLGGPTRPHCWRLTARLPSDAACPARPRGRGSGFPPVSSHGSPVSASRARLFPAARSHRGLSGSARVHQEAGTRRRTEAHLRGGGPGPGNHRDYRPGNQSRRPGALFAPPEASAHSTPILPPTAGSSK